MLDYDEYIRNNESDVVKRLNMRITKKTRSSSPYADIDWEKAAVIFSKNRDTVKSKGKLPGAKDILRLLAGAGTIGAIFVFPGAAPALGTLFLGNKEYSRWQTKQVVSQLSKRKFVEIQYLPDGRVRVKITKAGMTRALTYALDNMSLKKPAKWDGKWRVAMFDIPKKYGRVRDIFRMRLMQLGLLKLQESVYVYPYPCFDEIEFIRELYSISFTVQYLLVEKLEDDEYLRDRFELSV